MNLYLLIVAAMWRILCDIATTKTQRYFLSSIEKQKADDNPEIPKLVCDVVRTFCVVMTKRSKNSMVLAEGEQYPVSEYQFPTNWWSLARARIVYASRGSIDYVTPYFQFEGIDGPCISPSRVARFFESYNAAQTETTRIKIEGVPAEFNDFAYLNQFKTLMVGDDVADWNMASGVFDEMVSQVLAIPCPVDPEFVRTWESFEERSVDKWLMSVE